MKSAKVAALVSLLLTLSSVPARSLEGFVKNLGQADSRVEFSIQGPSSAIYFTRKAVVFDLRDPASQNLAGRGAAIRAQFQGSNPDPEIECRGRLPYYLNYFRGGDSNRWRSHVPVYQEIIYRDLWPGVDLRYWIEGGDLKYEFILAPGADADRIAFEYEGARSVRADSGGVVLIDTEAGLLVDHRPSPLGGPGGFSRAGHSDPGDSSSRDDMALLLWSTFLGGDYIDYAEGLALDGNDNVYVTGMTMSSDFPVSAGAYDTVLGGIDAFVAKLNASGSALIWGSYLGSSSGDDKGEEIVLTTDTVIPYPIVMGITWAADFPVTALAYDTSWNGLGDAFVTKLSPAGDHLVWSTFLGGSGDEVENSGMGLDSNGNVVVAGGTYSDDFPTTVGAFDNVNDGGIDAFLSKLSANGHQLLWSTFIGGLDKDAVHSMAIDDADGIVLAGATWSPDYPTTGGAYDVTFNSEIDGFITKVEADGTSLIWSSFLGGSGRDKAEGLALTGTGRPVVTGETLSDDFPVTAGAYDESHNGEYDAYAAQLSSDGSSLIWSTFLGGDNIDAGLAVAVDSEERVIVAGETRSANFPTVLGYDESYNGQGDAFVAVLYRTGQYLVWGSFLGGGSEDLATRLALDSHENAVICGNTISPDFPVTPGAFSTVYGYAYDTFEAKFDIWSSTVSVEDHLPPEGRNPLQIVSSLPNPFASEARIRFSVSGEKEGLPLDLSVFDVQGRRLRTLASGFHPNGSYEVVWDGKTSGGLPAASGVYFCRLRSGGSASARRLVLMR